MDAGTLKVNSGTIRALWMPDGQVIQADASFGTVTRIVPYHENGQLAPVVWFAVYDDRHHSSFPAQRINSAHVARVEYEL
jgi:hypothetical protein